MAHKPRRGRRPALLSGDGGQAAIEPETSGSHPAIEVDRQTAIIGEVTSGLMEGVARHAADEVVAMGRPAQVPPHDHRDPGVGSAAAAADEPVRPAASDSDTETISLTGYEGDPPSAIETPVIDQEQDAIDEESDTPPSDEPVEAPVAPEDCCAIVASNADVTDDAPPRPQSVAAPAPGLPAETLRSDDAGPSASSSGALGLMGAHVVETLASHLEANRHFLTALLGATTMTEVVAANTDHIHRQVELFTAQGRQLAVLARSVTFDSLTRWGPLPTDRGFTR